MMASRGMGAIRASKMPKKKVVQRKDDPNDVDMYAKGGKVKKMAEGDLVDDSPEDAVSLVKKNLAGQAGVKPEKSASDQSQFSVKPLAVALNPDAKSVFTKTRISGKRQLDKDSDIQAYLDADLSKNPNQRDRRAHV